MKLIQFTLRLLQLIALSIFTTGFLFGFALDWLEKKITGKSYYG